MRNDDSSTDQTPSRSQEGSARSPNEFAAAPSMDGREGHILREVRETTHGPSSASVETEWNQLRERILADKCTPMRSLPGADLPPRGQSAELRVEQSPADHTPVDGRSGASDAARSGLSLDSKEPREGTVSLPATADSLERDARPTKSEPRISPCPLIEPDQSNTRDHFCRDTAGEAMGQHGGLRQHRSVGEGTIGSQQCVFNKDGSLHTGEHQGTIDLASPVTGERRDGSCISSPLSVINHFVSDVLTHRADPEKYDRVQQAMRDLGVPSGSTGSGIYESGITDSELRSTHAALGSAPREPIAVRDSESEVRSSHSHEIQGSANLGDAGGGEASVVEKSKTSKISGVELCIGTKCLSLEHVVTDTVGHGTGVTSHGEATGGSVTGRAETFSVKNLLNGDKASFTIGCEKGPLKNLPDCSVGVDLCGSLNKSERACSSAEFGTNASQVSVGREREQNLKGGDVTVVEGKAKIGLLAIGVTHEHEETKPAPPLSDKR